MKHFVELTSLALSRWLQLHAKLRLRMIDMLLAGFAPAWWSSPLGYRLEAWWTRIRRIGATYAAWTEPFKYHVYYYSECYVYW